MLLPSKTSIQFGDFPASHVWLPECSNICFLISGWATPEKYEFVSWDDYCIPNRWRNESHVPVTTNQVFSHWCGMVLLKEKTIWKISWTGRSAIYSRYSPHGIEVDWPRCGQNTSKLCSPGEHQNSWQMDLHHPKKTDPKSVVNV